MNGSLREDSRAGFTWFPGDWLSDEGVRSVTFAAKGLWIGMICLMARSAKRGKLLDHVGANADSKWLANQLGGEPKEIDLLLAELERENVFSRHEGGIICRKMWRPTNLSEIRAEAGRLGALAKHQQTDVAKPGNGGKGKERRGSVVVQQEIEFDVFYKAYPNKKQKKDALKAWKQATDRPALAVLLAALESQKASDAWQKDGGQFIPYPASWLRAGSWDDEVLAGGKSAAKNRERALIEAEADARNARALAFSKVHVGDVAVGPPGRGVVEVAGIASIAIQGEGYGIAEVRDMEEFRRWTFAAALPKQRENHQQGNRP